MADFENCIRSAQTQGALSEDEADALIDRYNEHVEGLRASGVRDADAGAKAALAKEKDGEAAIKRAVAQGAEEARDELAGYFQKYRDRKGRPDVFNAAMNVFENFGFGAATSSAAGLAHAKFNLAISGMADMLSTFRRTAITGRRMNIPQAENVVKEILGEATGNLEAKGFASATQDAFEKVRQDFNKAARYEAIGKLDYGYLPQNHNAQKMLDIKGTPEEKYKAWSDQFRKWFDPNPDPITGAPLSPERTEAALRSTWRRVITGGGIDREPSTRPFGLGAVANQRSEQRFWHPKDAESWIAWNKEFGDGDPIVAIFQHLRGMTKDIALMERLGPNPSATTEWIKQVVEKEVQKQQVGDPSLYTKRMLHFNPEKSLPFRIQSMYDYLRGDEVVSKKIASFVGSTRNVLTSAELGLTSVLAAAQDPFVDMAARHLTGLPQGKALTSIFTALSKEKSEVSVRAGLGLSDFKHIMGTESRYAGTLGGSEITRWVADRVVHWNGLEPMTQARQHDFGMSFMGALADHSENKVGFDDLPRFLRRSMEDYGLATQDWDKLRAIDVFHPQPDSAGILRPSDVADKNQKLGERYLEMILGQTERAVPTGTIRSKSLLTGSVTRGTVWGEISNSALQYKNFGLSWSTLQWQAIQMELDAGGKLGAARGAAYAVGALALPLTLAGALAMQIQSLLSTKDFQPMNYRFWIAALLKGGGLGVLGDYLFADYSRFGHPALETAAGPLIGFMADIIETPLRLAQKEGREQIGGEKLKVNPGREAVKFLRRYTPGGTLPFTKAAYQRMFLDQLQYLLDPEAHKYFRAQEQQLHRDTGQSFFWRPGEMTPARGPQMTAH
jgi:hypothetical protein